MSPTQALISVAEKVTDIEYSIKRINHLLKRANDYGKKAFIRDIADASLGFRTFVSNDQNIDQDCINDITEYIIVSLNYEKERLENLLSEMTEPLNIAQAIEDLTKPEPEPVLPDFD